MSSRFNERLLCLPCEAPAGALPSAASRPSPIIVPLSATWVAFGYSSLLQRFSLRSWGCLLLTFCSNNTGFHGEALLPKGGVRGYTNTSLIPKRFLFSCGILGSKACGLLNESGLVLPQGLCIGCAAACCTFQMRI